MGNPSKNSSKCIVKNFTNQQLGISSSECLSYQTILHFVKNLRPLIDLKNSPELGRWNTQISEIQFNKKGNLIASTLYGDDTVYIWDWCNRKFHKSFNTDHGVTVNEIKWVSADDNLVVTTGESGLVQLTNLNTNTVTSLLKFPDDILHFTRHYKLAVNENLPFTVLVGSRTGTLVDIDVREKSCSELLKIENHKYPDQYDIQSIDINPVRYFEFCIGSSEDVRIYDRRNLSFPVKLFFPKLEEIEPACFMNQGDNVNVAYNYNGSEILSAYSKSSVYLFSVLGSHPVKNYYIPKNSDFHKICNVHYIGSKSEFIVASTIGVKFLYPEDAMISDLSYPEEKIQRPHELFFWDKDSTNIIREISISRNSWKFSTHPHLPILAMNNDGHGIQIWQ